MYLCVCSLPPLPFACGYTPPPPVCSLPPPSSPLAFLPPPHPFLNHRLSLPLPLPPAHPRPSPLLPLILVSFYLPTHYLTAPPAFPLHPFDLRPSPPPPLTLPYPCPQVPHLPLLPFPYPLFLPTRILFPHFPSPLLPSPLPPCPLTPLVTFGHITGRMPTSLAHCNFSALAVRALGHTAESGPFPAFPL